MKHSIAATYLFWSMSVKAILSIILAQSLITFSVGASAMDVNGYRESVKKSKEVSAEGMIRKGLLMGYHGGVASTMNQILSANGGVINMAEIKLICMPSDISIDSVMVESAIDIGLKSNKITSALGSDFENTDITSFAFVGLGNLFPCK